MSLPCEDSSVAPASLEAHSWRPFYAVQGPFGAGTPSPHHLSRLISHFILEQNWTIDSSLNTPPCLRSFALHIVFPLTRASSPTCLPEDFNFLWRQVMLKKDNCVVEQLYLKFKHKLLLLSLMTPDFYCYYECKPYCSCPIRIIAYYCLFSLVLFWTLSETCFKIAPILFGLLSPATST